MQLFVFITLPNGRIFRRVYVWSESDYPHLGNVDQECSFAHPISQEHALAIAAGNVEMTTPALQRSQEAALKALA